MIMWLFIDRLEITSAIRNLFVRPKAKFLRCKNICQYIFAWIEYWIYLFTDVSAGAWRTKWRNIKLLFTRTNNLRCNHTFQTFEFKYIRP